MSGNKVLLDTNVIIYASKQLLDIDKLLAKYDEFYVSIITYMEVYGYPFSNPQEEALVGAFFETVEVLDIDLQVAQQVIYYRKNITKKIKLPDAIILATAKSIGAELLSDDWTDFKNIDDSVKLSDICDLKTT